MSKTLKAATSISAWTLASRLVGLVRDVVMFRLLGAGWETGTFLLAWMFPNMLRRLVGEGALAASFVPAYSSALDRDGKPEANRLLSSVSGALLAGLIALSFVVVAFCLLAPPSWLGHAPESGGSAAESGALLLQLTAILFPYVILICLVALYSGALNAHSVFAGPAALPVVLNCFWIVGLLVGSQMFAGDANTLTTVLAVSLVVGGAAQLGIVVVQLARRGSLPPPGLPRSGDPARAVFANMLPTALGMSVLQLNTLIDQGFAYYLIDPGAPSHVYMANRLMQFPHALTSIALATAAFPSFAVLASRNEMGALRTEVDTALQTTLFLAIPASVGLMLVAPEFLEVFFVHGEFTADDAHVSSLATAGLVGGLPFLGAAQLYARALYALGNMRFPARVAAALVPLNLVLNVLLVLVLDFGVAGLTVATSLCSVVNVVLLRRHLQRQCPTADVGLAPLAKTVLATGAMALVVWGSRHVFEATTRTETFLLDLGLPIGLGMATYGVMQWLLGSRDLRRLMGRARR